MFDVDTATRRGIPVCNIPNYCSSEVVLILGASRQLVHSTLSVRQWLWNRVSGRLTMHRFSSQAQGLIGFGHIAREVARYAKSFGFAVSAFDPCAPDEAFAERNVTRASLGKVISGSDVVSCHTPLSNVTHHLLNDERFAAMKDGVIIVNTSCAGVIDEAALIAALQSGKVAAAGLDIVENDVMPPTIRCGTWIR